MQKLKKFVQEWNNGGLLKSHFDPEVLEWYGEQMQYCLQRQFTSSGQEDHTGLRMSQLGKPAVVLAAEKLAAEDPDLKPRYAMQYTFLTGDFFEQTLVCLLHQYGCEIHSLQEEVKYKGVVGHIDFCADDVLIEAKTMSGYYFNSFIQQPDDDRGYLTQLHLYQQCMQQKSAAWLCVNKWNSELTLVELEWDESYIERAEQIIRDYKKVNTFDDIKKYFSVPNLIPVSTRKNKIPPTMQWSGMNNLFYNFDSRGNPVSTKF